ncbi:MAG TPA: hypothetical protein VF300_00095 [Methanothrix sp.]
MKAEINSDQTAMQDQTETPENAESKCADDLWNYITAHEDELEDLEDFARRRGFKPMCSSDKH